MGELFYYTRFHCTFIPQSRTKWRLVIAPVLSEEDVMLFLGTAHWNYARYITWHIQDLQSLELDAEE